MHLNFAYICKNRVEKVHSHCMCSPIYCVCIVHWETCQHSLMHIIVKEIRVSRCLGFIDKQCYAIKTFKPVVDKVRNYTYNVMLTIMWMQEACLMLLCLTWETVQNANSFHVVNSKKTKTLLKHWTQHCFLRVACVHMYINEHTCRNRINITKNT